MIRIPEHSRVISIDGYVIDLACGLLNIYCVFSRRLVLYVRTKDVEPTTLRTCRQAPIIDVNWIER